MSPLSRTFVRPLMVRLTLAVGALTVGHSRITSGGVAGRMEAGYDLASFTARTLGDGACSWGHTGRERILKGARFLNQVLELVPLTLDEHVVAQPGGEHVGVSEGALYEGHEFGRESIRFCVGSAPSDC